MNGQTATPESGVGYLIVRVSTADGAIPIEDAVVTVRNYDTETDIAGDIIYLLRTGADGNTPRVSLSAPSVDESFTPGGNKAYSTYNVDVVYDGYYAQYYTNVPIFEGITAVQGVDMIPLPENGKSDSRTPDGNRYFESENPEL